MFDEMARIARYVDNQGKQSKRAAEMFLTTDS